MLSAAYRALHGLGLLETYSLSTMPLASDVAAFTRSWTSAVQIARLLCLLIVLAYVTAFAFLLRALVEDWRVALLGTFAIAFSGGIAMSVRSVKPELLSGAFFAIALLILLISARSPRMAARPMLIGIAAFFATLAMDNKVQAIFLIMHTAGAAVAVWRALAAGRLLDRASCRLGAGSKCPICLVRRDSRRTSCAAGPFCR